MKKNKLVLILLSCIQLFLTQAQTKLPEWEKGFMDIHTISTGRGNCQFFIFPDGTTMMVDAGDFDGEAYNAKYAPMLCAPIFPDSTFTPAQTIINYVTKILGNKEKIIDYFLLTHFHTDHYGAVKKGQFISKEGGYYLSGLTEVCETIPIKKLIDRDYPLYNYPIDLIGRKTKENKDADPTFTNYHKFITYQKEHKKMQIEKLQVGVDNQIVLLKNKASFPDFRIRNIKTNDMLWSGTGKKANSLFTKKQLINTNGSYSENQLSLAILIEYGTFKYYTGGDNSGLEDQDHAKWYDIETPMAKVIGKVSAMTLNHHGNRDATNSKFLNTLDPQVVIMQTWSSDHPGQEVGQRLISSNIGTRKRDIFMTYYNPLTGIGIGPWFERDLKAKNGNFVLRVYPNGLYEVYVLDCTKKDIVVIDKFGPYKNNQ